ncbi:MAG: WG repeat-containing protein [Ignavibacteria bacterium]|nr:WG repeat-containing protein [Ignavibacteria bacterium]
MKTTLHLLFTILILSGILFSQEAYQPLFKIYENGLYGYINSTGKIIIPPKYKGAGEFSEGLAPVRENGYYGYIDMEGKYVIDPKFDYGNNFSNGFAIIYVNSKSNYIDRFGRSLLAIEYLYLSPFENDKAMICTFSGKYGIINSEGKVIVDTNYKEISKLRNGFFVAQDYNNEYTMIDSIGNIIVHPGRYNKIYELYNGFAKVLWYEENIEGTNKWSMGFINSMGELVYSKENAPEFNISDFVSVDSIFIVSEHICEKNDNSQWDSRKLFEGLMNINSELLCIDSSGSSFHFIGDNIYILDSAGMYSRTDNQGNKVGPKTFCDEMGKKSIYSVSGNQIFGIIDTSQNFVIEPFFDLKCYLSISEGCFIFGKYLRDVNGNILLNSNREYVSKWGIGSYDGTVIREALFDEADWGGFINGLLLVKDNDKPAYIDKKGNRIWIQSNNSYGTPESLNVDFRIQTKYSDNFWGWRPIISKPIDEQFDDFLEESGHTEESITLLLNNEKTLFRYKFDGITMYIINNSDSNIAVPTVDGEFYLVFQAIDKDGIWKQIESYPSSFCGNSYVNTYISAKRYYKYSVPKYYGEIRTKIRAVLSVKGRKNTEVKIYSNEINGSVNPAQFWRELPIFTPTSFLESKMID